MSDQLPEQSRAASTVHQGHDADAHEHSAAADLLRRWGGGAEFCAPLADVDAVLSVLVQGGGWYPNTIEERTGLPIQRVLSVLGELLVTRRVDAVFGRYHLL